MLRSPRRHSSTISALNSGVNDRRGRGFFLSMVSILDILSGAVPLMVDVRTDRNFCTGIDLKEVAAAGGFAGMADMTSFGPVRGSGQTHRVRGRA